MLGSSTTFEIYTPPKAIYLVMRYSSIPTQKCETKAMKYARPLLTFMSLTSVPRLLHASERNGGLRYRARICTNHTNLESFGYSPYPTNILREKISREAIFRIVRQCDDLLFRFKLGQCSHGSESFFGVQQRVVWDICQDGGRVEIRTFVLQVLATSKNRSTTPDRVLYVIMDLCDRAVVNKRTMRASKGNHMVNWKRARQ